MTPYKQALGDNGKETHLFNLKEPLATCQL